MSRRNLLVVPVVAVCLSMIAACNNSPGNVAGEPCGNGFCGAGENVSNCPQDCGGSGDGRDSPGEVCGNGFCGSGENVSNCAQDCGGDSNGDQNTEGELCGNGFCGAGEDVSNCPGDCGGGDEDPDDSGEICGNGFCGAGENARNCPRDCDDGGGSSRSITITRPSGSGRNPYYPDGSSMEIRWTSTGDVGDVRIELLYDPSAFGDPEEASRVDRVIASRTADTGLYLWEVPNGQHPNSDYFVRVSDADDDDVVDVSREISVGGN